MGTSADLFIAFDRSRRRGLRVPIEDELRAAIRSGRLRPGTLVPSTRAFAADLNITRKVVVEAYDQLVADGYLPEGCGDHGEPRSARPGRGLAGRSGGGPG